MKCLILLIILFMWSCAAEEDQAQAGLDMFAAPSVIIAGSVKSGTSFLWHMIRSLHVDFESKNRKGQHSVMEKEFNVAHRSRQYLRIDGIDASEGDAQATSCPCEVVKNLMQCPMTIARNSNHIDTVLECKIWLDLALQKRKKGLSRSHNGIANFIVPKYTVDANPYLMRNALSDIPVIRQLNAEDSTCDKVRQRTKKPMVMVLLRDPITRTASYYNYFSVNRAKKINEERSKYNSELHLKQYFDGKGKEKRNDEQAQAEQETEPKPMLEIMAYADALKLEYNVFISNQAIQVPYAMYQRKLKIFLDELESNDAPWNTIVSLGVDVVKQFAKVKDSHELKWNEKLEDLSTSNSRQLLLDVHGYLLDDFYLPQILSLLFEEVDNGWPLMVIQSEHLFSNPEKMFQSHILSYFHPNLSNSTLSMKRTTSTKWNKDKNAFRNEGNYNHDELLDKLSSKLIEYEKRKLLQMLFHLQRRERIKVVPQIVEVVVEQNRSEYRWW